MEPWYKVATPRKEVREGRSFNPDEFAIAFEQVVAGAAPQDYREPDQFFARTCFTRALREHTAMVLRRLSGRTDNTAPVLTLITQFGGGKTHTLTALYHLARSGDAAAGYSGVAELLREAGIPSVPTAKVGVFVATHGIRSRGGRHRGSTWPGNSRGMRGGSPRIGCEDDAARHRFDRAGVPGGWCAGAPPLRRSAELPEPAPGRR